MMLLSAKAVPAAVGTFCAVFWLVLHIRCHRRYLAVTERLDPKEFQLCELFYIGFGMIDLFRINLNSPQMQSRTGKLAEIYDQYAEFYNYVLLGQKLTYFATMMPVVMFAAAILGEPMLALLGAVATLLIVFYIDEQTNNQISNKQDEIESDFPMMLSKLALLVNAGVILRDAWIHVSTTGERALYQEMQKVVDEMHNGVSLPDAVAGFSKRCSSREVKKFSSAVIQNINKGSAELSRTLREMSRDSWFERKHSVRKKGELASQKMLLPTILMFVGILMIIIVPIFMSMV